MSYVWAGYSITLASLAAYALWVLRRARGVDRRGRR
jgi:heme exporter protein CcmD